jgi:hypothetical protein
MHNSIAAVQIESRVTELLTRDSPKPVSLTWLVMHHFSVSYWLGFTFVFRLMYSLCIGQYKFLWTLEINIHLSLKASVNIVFKVNKNLYWQCWGNLVITPAQCSLLISPAQLTRTLMQVLLMELAGRYSGREGW